MGKRTPYGRRDGNTPLIRSKHLRLPRQTHHANTTTTATTMKGTTSKSNETTPSIAGKNESIYLQSKRKNEEEELRHILPSPIAPKNPRSEKRQKVLKDATNLPPRLSDAASNDHTTAKSSSVRYGGGGSKSKRTSHSNSEHVQDQITPLVDNRKIQDGRGKMRSGRYAKTLSKPKPVNHVEENVKVASKESSKPLKLHEDCKVKNSGGKFQDIPYEQGLSSYNSHKTSDMNVTLHQDEIESVLQLNSIDKRRSYHNTNADSTDGLVESTHGVDGLDRHKDHYESKDTKTTSNRPATLPANEKKKRQSRPADRFVMIQSSSTRDKPSHQEQNNHSTSMYKNHSSKNSNDMDYILRGPRNHCAVESDGLPVVTKNMMKRLKQSEADNASLLNIMLQSCDNGKKAGHGRHESKKDTRFDQKRQIGKEAAMSSLGSTLVGWTIGGRALQRSASVDGSDVTMPRDFKEAQEDKIHQQLYLEKQHEERLALHPELPPGWVMHMSVSKNRLYYTHPDFGSTWHCPVVLPKSYNPTEQADVPSTALTRVDETHSKRLNEQNMMGQLTIYESKGVQCGIHYCPDTASNSTDVVKDDETCGDESTIYHENEYDVSTQSLWSIIAEGPTSLRNDDLSIDTKQEISDCPKWVKRSTPSPFSASASPIYSHQEDNPNDMNGNMDDVAGTPSVKPSRSPSIESPLNPSTTPSVDPSLEPSVHQESNPNYMNDTMDDDIDAPSAKPSGSPSVEPSLKLSSSPNIEPSLEPPVDTFQESPHQSGNHDIFSFSSSGVSSGSESSLKAARGNFLKTQGRKYTWSPSQRVTCSHAPTCSLQTLSEVHCAIEGKTGSKNNGNIQTPSGIRRSARKRKAIRIQVA